MFKFFFLKNCSLIFVLAKSRTVLRTNIYFWYWADVCGPHPLDDIPLSSPHFTIDKILLKIVVTFFRMINCEHFSRMFLPIFFRMINCEHFSRMFLHLIQHFFALFRRPNKFCAVFFATNFTKSLFALHRVLKFSIYTKVVPMNVVIVILLTSSATYHSTYKAHVFHKSRCVQGALDHLLTWNTSWDMGWFGKWRFADSYETHRHHDWKDAREAYAEV